MVLRSSVPARRGRDVGVLGRRLTDEGKFMTLKVLVVDDSSLIRNRLRSIFLETGGFEVKTAPNGQLALDMVRNSRPDVVTLDVQMPVMDGLECLERLMGENPLPVVMLSSLTAHGAETTFKALRLGAVDFVEKPSAAGGDNPDMFERKLVGKVRAAAAAKVRAAATARPGAAPFARPLPAAGFHLQPSAREPRRVPAAPPVQHPARPLSPAPAPKGAPRPFVRAGAAAGLRPEAIIVGASTGGPPLVERLIARLPADLRQPLLVVQHMPARFTAAWAERLGKTSAVPVVEVDRPTPLTPGRVYLARGDGDCLVRRGPHGPEALPAASSPDYPWHPSVNRLVEGAIQTWPPERLLCLLLTGMGDDGASAIAAAAELGAKTVAEAESTAVIFGMPRRLIEAGGAKEVLPNDRIVERLPSWIA